MLRQWIVRCCACTVALGFLTISPPSLAAGALELVTIGYAGQAVGGHTRDMFQSVSADGRYILFRSDSDAVVPGDSNGRADLFVRDRLAGRTLRVNVNTNGVASNADVGFASISDDGRYVVFDSVATNLVPNDTNDASDVFLRDLQAGTTSRVSVSSSGQAGNRASSMASISADGRYVAFASGATNFVRNVRSGLYVRDRLTQRTTYLKGTAYAQCGWARISGDGRYVAFECSWSYPGWGAGHGKRNGFLYERDTDHVFLVVKGFPHNTRITDVSHDGRYVAFHSQRPLLADDTNRMWDAYMWDRVTGQYERVSLTQRERQANLQSYWPTMTGDLRFFAFVSYAGNLVQDDPNRQAADVFVRDRLLGTTERVSDGTGLSEFDGSEIGADGTVVVFVTSARLLPSDASDGTLDVYARELNAPIAAKDSSP